MPTHAFAPRLTALALGAALLLGTAGCAAEPAPVTGGTLTWAIEGGNLANGHLDPHSSQLDVSAYVQRNVFDSLVALGPDGAFHPWLATSWTVSDDGLEYVFQLRDDVTFHDGERFDAAAAVKNFEHIFAPGTASAQAASALGGDTFAGAEATGEFELTLRTSAPYGPLLTNLSTAFAGFYSPKVLAEKTQDQLRAGGPGISVGTGPFVLSAYTPNQQLVFTRNEAYRWAPEGAANQGPAYLDRLVVRIIPEESGRAGAIAADEAQVAVNLTPNGIAQAGPEAVVQRTASPGLPYSAILNWRHGVFADQKVRQAFALGIDLDAAVAGAFQGAYDRAWSILSPSTPNAYDASLEGSRPHDAAAANALLDEAGWTARDEEGYRVKDGRRLSAEWLSWQPYPDERQALVDFLAADLKDLGFELVHEAVEGATYQSRYYTEAAGFVLDFDITDWGFAYLDGDILRNHLHSAGYQNATTVADPALDALLDQAAASADPATRAGLYAQVQQWNAEQLAIVPLYLPQFAVASTAEVRGLAYDAFGWPLFQGASLGG